MNQQTQLLVGVIIAVVVMQAVEISVFTTTTSDFNSKITALQSRHSLSDCHVVSLYNLSKVNYTINYVLVAADSYGQFYPLVCPRP